MTTKIIPFWDGALFDPAEVEVMIVQEVIAKRIIAIGRTGERSPDKICELALGAFSIPV